ncbi:MAG: zinc ABC transporter substrate-binding protein [Mucinivorans sp.]
MKNKKIILVAYLIPIISLMLMVAACTQKQNAKQHYITVSIAPLTWVVEGLMGQNATLQTIVPPGTSPETYEPTARQSEDLARAELIFSVGLVDSERQIEQRLRDGTSRGVFVRLADSLPTDKFLRSSCATTHTQADSEHHHGAVDPHVWLSPSMMREITRLVALHLIDKQIDSAALIVARRDSLFRVISQVDSTIRADVERSKSKYFAIVHPSLGYFAAEYGLTQFSIEVDGKEPSGRRIRDLVDTLRDHEVRAVIYSRQDPSTSARVIAKEIGARVVVFDPMAKDWAANMIKISKIVCQTN